MTKARENGWTPVDPIEKLEQTFSLYEKVSALMKRRVLSLTLIIVDNGPADNGRIEITFTRNGDKT